MCITNFIAMTKHTRWILSKSWQIFKRGNFKNLQIIRKKMRHYKQGLPIPWWPWAPPPLGNTPTKTYPSKASPLFRKYNPLSPTENNFPDLRIFFSLVFVFLWRKRFGKLCIKRHWLKLMQTKIREQTGFFVSFFQLSVWQDQDKWENRQEICNWGYIILYNIFD